MNWGRIRKLYGIVEGLPGVREVQDQAVNVLGRHPVRATAVLPDGTRLCVDLATRGARSLWLRGRFDEVNVGFLTDALRPGDAFFDVGANVGYYAARARAAVGAAGLVVAVEANPWSASLVARSIHENGWDNVALLSCAASDRAGFVRFDAVADSGLSHISEEGTRGVLALPLDDVRDALEDRSLGGVKIDVEGHELAVLEGMSQIFDERPPRRLLAEAHATKGRAHVEALFRWLGERGYEAVHPGEPSRPCEVDEVLAGVWNVGFVREEDA
jgi:FkbM family methyltransferase